MNLSLPIGILGQVWYLTVSIPDLCTLLTFKTLSQCAAMKSPELVESQNLAKNGRTSGIPGAVDGARLNFVK